MLTIFGEDTNNPGESNYPRGAIKIPPVYKPAIVVDIIINEKSIGYNKRTGENIGEAKVKLLVQDETLTADSDGLNTAYPIETNILEFPLVGEVVNLMFIAGKLYYSRRINLLNKISEDISDVIVRLLAENPNLYNPRMSGASDPNAATNLTLAQGSVTSNYITPTENVLKQSDILFPEVLSVKPHIGDIIFQGRFGTIIRMGSSLFSNPTKGTPSPNLLLTAGLSQTPTQVSTTAPSIYSLQYEDINEDKSSIWLVSKEEVVFNAATQNSTSPNKAHLRGSEIPKIMPHYVGAQIFINSDRVVLNSKREELSLFSKREINLSALESITIASEKHVFISTNEDVKLKSDKDITLDAKNSLTLSATKDISTNSENFSISAKKIYIGSNGDTSQPMVLGSNLAGFLYAFIETLKNTLPLSVIATPIGPGSIQIPALITSLNVLQKQLGDVGNPQSAMFNSKDNFVAEKNSAVVEASPVIVTPPVQPTAVTESTDNPNSDAATTEQIITVETALQRILANPNLVGVGKVFRNIITRGIIINQLRDEISKYNITDPLVIAHFLSQAAHESLSFSKTTENLNYSVDTLANPDSGISKYFTGVANQYARKPEQIANRFYANRLGNGPEASGDGWKYRGRGYIQLTGKANYTAFNPSVPENVIERPDLVESKYPMQSAMWFFMAKPYSRQGFPNRVYKIALEGSTDQIVRRVTLAVNGGFNGLQERIQNFRDIYGTITGTTVA